jgi:phosphatidate phosphatase PAH1
MLSTMRLALLAVALVGCAGNLHVDPYAPKQGGVIAPAVANAVPDVRCAGTPQTGGKRGFHKLRHRIATTISRANHRGFDLIANTDQAQVLSGKLAYGVVDKRLDGEEVELFACIAGTWQQVGSTRSDARGRFALPLDGAARLPVGLRDLYASVVADRSGVRFLAYVAPADARLIVTDVDGTLTSSENSFAKAVMLGRGVKPHPGAVAALRAVAARGYQVIYVTARPDRFTDATRVWLGNNGFPRGPVRLADALFVKPGKDTIAYKQRALGALKQFDVVAGVGNRKSDVAAYSSAGIPAERIFVKLPEYTGELGEALRGGAAVGFGMYGPLAVP